MFSKMIVLVSVLFFLSLSLPTTAFYSESTAFVSSSSASFKKRNDFVSPYEKLFLPSVLTVESSTTLRNDLWGEPPQKAGEDSKDRSIALPFAPRPKLLDGSLPGDAGFDPFGFAGADKASLLYMREAEIKHCRLAMLAAVGWPIAELVDKPIADAVGLPTALTKSGSSPSLLNGGLDKIDGAYWVAVIALAGIIELENSKVRDVDGGKSYIAGDCNFDPLKLFPTNPKERFAMQTKELKNGRLAMMAILGFVAQEAIYRVPVVAETPMFFKPLF